jgi:PAS domain S-box-containing protein
MNKIVLVLICISLFLIASGISSAFAKGRHRIDPVADSKDTVILRKKTDIDQMNNISYSLRFSSSQLSYSCANKALAMAKEINYPQGMAKAYFLIGLYNDENHDFLSAIKFSLLSCDLAKATGDYWVLDKSLNIIGTINCYIKRNDRSFRYFSFALKIANEIHDTEQIINIYLKLSEVYSDSNKSEIVKKYLFNALYFSLKQHNQDQEALTYKYIGIFSLRQNDYNKALYYFEKSIHEYIAINEQLQVGSIYTLIAHVYEQLKDFKASLIYNRIALSYRFKYNRDEQVASSFVNIGHTYLEMDQLDSALYYLKTGIALASVFNFKKNVLLEAGYRYLYLLYERKGDDQIALRYYTRYSLFQDSVKDEKNKGMVSSIETNYVINEHEKEAKALKEENLIQKLEMKNRGLLELLLVALILLASIIVVYIQQLLIKNKKAKKIVEEKNDQLQDECNEQAIQNEELAKREEEYRFLADNTADLVTLMDGNFKRLYVSPSSKLLLGYSADEIIAMNDPVELIHPDSRESFRAEAEKIFQYHEASRFLYQVIKKDDNVLWVESNINPIFDPITGKLQAIITITRDVSSQIEEEQALMESAKQKDMLIREVHHRVKNNLALLTSLVNMQKSEFTDHKTLDVFSDLQFRVKAMALVHEELYKSRNIEFMSVGEYLSKLVGIVSSAFTTSKVKVHQDFQDETLNVKIILPLGLIVNELLTNAFKYAFPDQREGNIWVTYKKEPNTNTSRTEMRCLTVRDDGKGLPVDFDISKQASMGSQIISLLVRQLEAKLIIDGTNGASFSIILPSER